MSRVPEGRLLLDRSTDTIALNLLLPLLLLEHRMLARSTICVCVGIHSLTASKRGARSNQAQVLSYINTPPHLRRSSRL